MSGRRTKGLRRAANRAAGAVSDQLAEAVLQQAEQRIQTGLILRERQRWCPLWLYRFGQWLALKPAWRVKPGEQPRAP